MNQFMDADAQAIVDAIREAFAGVRRGAITLHEAEVIDSYGSDDERADARQRDTEQNWEDLPDQHIEECPWALCHLDPVSWRYYIPAYMIWSLRNFRSNDSIVSDFTIYTFDASDSDAKLREYSTERYRTLSPSQSRDVCRFLTYMANIGERADNLTAKAALKKYWGQFSPTAGS
jgi:hypothetical protein